MREYTRYDRETYMLPIWEGDTVYNESLLFVGDEPAPLLYRPDRVLAVLSNDLGTRYTEGVDYLVRDGRLVRIPTGRIPHFTLEEYYPTDPMPPAGVRHFPCAVPGHPYILVGEGDTFSSRQVQVTYTHTDAWEGFIPARSGLSRFAARAAAGEELTVLFFGDSITYGMNASGLVGCPPYADPWPKLVFGTLCARFPAARLRYVNTGIPSKNTAWGIDTLEENVLRYRPDLLVLAFGMNDGDLTPDGFAAAIRRMLTPYLAASPAGEALTVSTMLPHFRVKDFYRTQETHEAALLALAGELGDRVGVAPVTSVHRVALDRKRYFDLTGNNANHPNDFLSRLYAQTVIRALLG